MELTDEENIENQIFEIVNQLNYGKELIKNNDEIKQLAELNLSAGLKVKQTAAYKTAYKYLSVSHSLLNSNSWKNDYQFTLKIFDQITELAYLDSPYKTVLV